MSLKQSKLRRSEPQVEAVPSCGPGPRLRDARLARSLDLAQAARMLKLETPILAALEQDDYSVLPEPLYVRGYLTGYARLLGVPEQEVLAEYRSVVGETRAPNLSAERSVRPQARSSDATVRWFSYLVIVVVCGLVGWWAYEYLREESLDSLFVESVDTSVPVVGPPVVAAAGESAEPRVMTGRAGSGPESHESRRERAGLEPTVVAEKPAPAPREAGADSGVVVGEGPIPEVVVAERTPLPGPAAEPATAGAETHTAPARVETATVAVVPGMGNIDLRFSRDCWLEVRDAGGNRLAYGLARAGTSRSLQGRLPFKITLGDSGAVAVQLNGRQVSPGIYGAADGQPARFTLAGAEGG